MSQYTPHSNIFSRLSTDKSFVTNAIALGLFLGGKFSPVYSEHIMATGSYALSGALTNWLAVYMLFEKIPFLYGSGIIQIKFEEFKKAIRDLMMQEFFSPENLQKFLGNMSSFQIQAHELSQMVNRDLVFSKIIQAVETSPFGPMLAMFGGAEGLKKSLKPHFDEKLQEALEDIATSEEFQNAIKKLLNPEGGIAGDLLQKVETIVASRLDELTPQIVKNIIQNMIRSHLGWLVVWGGVFGGIIGLVSSLIS